MTTTPAVGATSATSLYTTGTTTAPPKQEMDKEVFLALLVAQLRNQDPTSPMDTTAMMAQSTQLATMEQMTAVAETGRENFALQMRIAASNLMGRDVSFVDETGADRTGVVTSVSFEGPVPLVTVGEWIVPLDAVSAIRDTAPAPAGAPTTAPTTPTSSPAA